MASPSEISNSSNNSILESLLNTLDEKIEELKGSSEALPLHCFSHSQFWQDFESCVKLVSKEATDLCMAYTSLTPTSTECKSLSSHVENAVFGLVFSYWRFPKSRGLTIHHVLFQYVSAILSSVKNLCSAIKAHNPDLLQKIGKVWEKCEALANIPKDNRDAVVKIFELERQLVDDARAELSDTILMNERVGYEQPRLQNGRMPTDDVTWMDSERRLVFRCLGLIKVYEVILRKLPTMLTYREDDNELWLNMLDEMAVDVKSSSALVDDLVLSIYPPIINSDIRQYANLIENKSRKILTIIKNFDFSTENDKTWITFAQTTLEHNWTDIRNLTESD